MAKQNAVTKKSDVKKVGYFARLRHDLAINKSLYLILLVPVLWYAIFAYGPMYGALMAFQKFNARLGIGGSPWVGLDNFVRFFSDPYFTRDLINTLRISIASVVFYFPMPIIFALLINEIDSRRFVKVVQTITYIPHFISLVVVCGMIKTFVASDGIITTLVSSLTGIEFKESLLNNANLFTTIFVGSDIWQNIAWSSIIYIAAIMGVEQQLYEAAAIDGAGRLRQVWYVTLPSILPTIITMLILRMGSIFSVNNEKILLLINQLNAEQGETLSYYIYKKGITNADYSLSSAAGLFNSVINLVFVVATNYISKKCSDTYLW